MSRSTKPVGSQLTSAQQAVLTALIDVYPHGFSRPELVAKLGHTAPSRVGELRRLGWRIPKGEMRGGSAYYRLETLVQGAPDITLAGMWTRLGSSSGWDADPYFEWCEDVPPDVLARAVIDSAAVFRSRVEPYLGKQKKPVVVEPEVDFLTMFEAAMSLPPVRDVSL